MKMLIEVHFNSSINLFTKKGTAQKNQKLIPILVYLPKKSMNLKLES